MARLKEKLTPKFKLLLGYTISGFGDQFYTFVIPLLMLSRSHSAVVMGLLTAMEYLPTALFGLVIGSVFDVYEKRKVMLVSLITQMVLILIIPLLVLNDLPLWLVLAAVFVIGLFDLLSWTGYQILIAESVSLEELSQISGQVGLVSSIQRMFGPGVAAVIINALGYLGGFLLDAVSFGYLTYAIKDFRPIRPEAAPQPGRKTIKNRTLAGLRFIWHNDRLKWLITSFFVANIGFQIVVPMLTFVLKQHMQVSIGLVSVFFTVASIAGILGNFVYLRVNKRLKLGHQLVFTGATILLGFGIMTGLYSFVLVTIGYALVSFGSVWSQANFFTIIQAQTPDQHKGMVTAASTTLTRVLGPVLAVLSGFLVNLDAHSIFLGAMVCMAGSIIVTLVGKLNRLVTAN